MKEYDISQLLCMVDESIIEEMIWEDGNTVEVSSDRIKEIDLNATKRRKLEEDIEKFKTSNKRSRN